jgi:hypothetical protein
MIKTDSDKIAALLVDKKKKKLQIIKGNYQYQNLRLLSLYVFGIYIFFFWLF